MFGLFKKKPSFTTKHVDFFVALVYRLPERYRFLLPQINMEFILGVKKNILGYKGSYTFLLNANIARDFRDKSMPSLLIIKNLGVWNQRSKAFEFVELYLVEGMFSGYKMMAPMEDLDPHIIDVNLISEDKSGDEDKLNLQKILGMVDPGLEEILDIQSTFKIEIPEGVFYVLKNLGDGNYLGVDENGGVYLLIHSPYTVELVFADVDSFKSALLSGKTDIQGLCESFLSSRQG
ncbi:hypothetical protein [Pedobacter deserti]|uniref:hypothetical protein n=1 Tax=Pedobacter deserti TaxID=2817382 RepID=UPI00210C30D3|nr:hypothetical protein [Pedobacter sp. SYSU D00382]